MFPPCVYLTTDFIHKVISQNTSSVSSFLLNVGVISKQHKLSIAMSRHVLWPYLQPVAWVCHTEIHKAIQDSDKYMDTGDTEENENVLVNRKNNNSKAALGDKIDAEPFQEESS